MGKAGSPSGQAVANAVDGSIVELVGDAVNHLSDYYKHLATIAGGAIAFLAAFSDDIRAAGSDGLIAVAAVAALGACVVMSTTMMWAYGVARRQTASEHLLGTNAEWAYRADPTSISFAKAIVPPLSLLTPFAYGLGFALLALYAFLAVLP